MTRVAATACAATHSPINLLIVGDVFPTVANPHRGIFILRQASLLKAHGVESRFLVTTPILPWPLSEFGPWKAFSSAPLSSLDPTLEIRSAHYPRPPGAWFRPYEGFSKSIPAALRAAIWNRTKRFDAVLGVDMTSGARAAVRIGKVLKIPVATLAIGSDVELRARENENVRREISSLLKHVQLPMGVSASVCDRIRALSPEGRDPLTVYLGRPHFQTNSDTRHNLRTRLGWGKDQIIAVYAGRLSREKGTQELAAVARLLLEKHPELKIVCLGDGPLRHRLQAVATATSRPGALEVWGWIPPETVRETLIASDFLVLPSYSEGLPQVVLEAMEVGLPVVGTRIGGIPEAVIHNENGLLIDPGNEDELAAAIERLVKDPTFRRRCGRKATERSISVFDSQQNAQAMARAIRDMVEKSRSDTRPVGFRAAVDAP